jgi:hypothetical protein
MASFTVEHETDLSKEETYKKVKKFFEGDTLRKLDDSLEFTFNDSSHTGKVKGSKFECHLKIIGESKAKVQITVSLSFFLTPFKGKIEETLKAKMTQVLG